MHPATEPSPAGRGAHRLPEGVVVPSVVGEGLLSQPDDVGAHAIQEVLGVGGGEGSTTGLGVQVTMLKGWSSTVCYPGQAARDKEGDA